MKIYLARSGVQAGPYSLDELNAMLISGEVLLDDLMWHSGMTNWVRLGEMTGGIPFYSPSQAPIGDNPAPKPTRGFGDNVEFRPEASPAQQARQARLDRLYGRKTHPNPIKSVVLRKDRTNESLTYAKVSERFLAFVINSALYCLVWLPLFMAFFGAMDANELAKITDYSQAYAYSQSLAKTMPQTTVIISNLLFMVLIFIQLILIIMRGQSFGKLAVGIRVVDETSHKLPSFGTLLFMRTLFLVSVYTVGAIFMSGMPALMMLATNYFMANANPKKQGWHDKLTKTVVVKAHKAQLDKTKG